jgi:hypothetical protein
MTDSVANIKAMIVEGSDGLFDDDEDLHVTIRIAQDFYTFLEKFGDNPPTEEVAYVSDTIRSGMDQFFLLAQSCRVIAVDGKNWFFDPHLSWDHPALRRAFLDGFRHLRNSTDASASQRLSWLLALTRLELTFLARHFPSAILQE